jgi:type IX secretion system PorP/SprF family membrane protein
MKRIIFSIILTGQILFAFSQDLNINHYPFYRDGLNPGSFIQSQKVNIMLLYNNEFWGFAKEPNTQMTDVSFVFDDYNKIGLMVYNDIIGYDKAQNIKVRYARSFILSDTKNYSFSLGIGTGVIHKNVQASKMVFENPSDPLSQFDYAHTVFDFDFGAEVKLDRLVFGLATNHLGKPLTSYDDVNPTPHYYGYAEYTTSDSPEDGFNFRPNLLFRYWKNTYWVEAGILAFYKDLVWLGGTYTDFHDLTFMAGLKLFKSDKNKDLHLGYAFKSNMNGKILGPWNTNSHEIFLSFGFGTGGSVFPKRPRDMQ